MKADSAIVIHSQKTRLEMEDLAMWRRMGLNLSTDGRLTDPASLYQKSHGGVDRTDMISNALIWLLSKLINLTTRCNDEVDAESSPTPPNPTSGTGSFLEEWFSLKKEFQMWYDALPPPFQPCSQVSLPPPQTIHRVTDGQLRFKSLIDHETWHSDSMCASTMQSYHMSQIIMLLHKPPTVSVRQLPWTSKTQSVKRFPDTLSDFNQMNEMLQFHSVEICAVALSRPEEAARIHMLQPLYLAGRCLTDMSDRGTVVKLIDGIEDELGWHAKYRVDALLVEWDTSRDALEYCHETTQLSLDMSTR